ncbi:MAG: two-component regulator propeller domain-containing protein [Chitinophagaceae bacterium]
MNLNTGYLKILLILPEFILLFGQTLYAQPERLNFERLSPGRCQSSATIYSILQDKRGLMWFASTDGLICYDGYKFKTYKHNSRDPYSLSEDWVTSLAEDENETFGWGSGTEV